MPELDRTAIRVLLADDEESMRYSLAKALTRSGYSVEAVGDGASALERFAADRPDVVVLDLKMPGVGGAEALDAILTADPDAVVVIMTAFGSIASAVEAMRRGACTYLTKPFELDELIVHVERALAHRATLRENVRLRAILDGRAGYGGLLGTSPAMQAVFQAIDALRDSDATVLLSGESGTGKELAARAIHARSRRADFPFVPVACASLAATLIDSQLFGHIAGAFTGALSKRLGLVARADRGTLFLDEIADLDLPAQAKLERFLQEREILPLGAAEPQRVDARIVAATSRDLDALVAAGALRKELLYRLEVLPVRMPPLRERREDIALLAGHFFARARASDPRARRASFTPAALEALGEHDWPGNVRELQNTIERLAAVHPDKVKIDVQDLPTEVLRPTTHGVAHPPAPGFRRAMAAHERTFLESLLARSGGNISEAARSAGLSRGHLHRKIREHGLDADRFRSHILDDKRWTT